MKYLHSKQNNPIENASLVFYLDQQYVLVQTSRELLLDYCATISNADFIKTNHAFGISSIRDLLVHIANCYQAWLGRALKQKLTFFSEEKIRTVNDTRKLFEKVDALMLQFIHVVEQKKPKTLEIEKNEERIQIPPLQLFSHVITHEFHHKGQILSLSRHLGYVPRDTDIIQ